MASTTWQKIKQLDAEDSRLLLAAALLLPVIAIALRIKGYEWTKRGLNNRVPATPIPNHRKSPTELARLVAIAANKSPYRANCLKKALLLWWLLARRGIASEIQLGINRDDNEFNAHAWVTLNGQILLDTDDVEKRYTVLNH